MSSNSLSSDRAARDNDNDEDNSVLSVEADWKKMKTLEKMPGSRKKRKRNANYDLEDTIEAADSKRSEQEEVLLNLKRELLEFEKSRPERLDRMETQCIELISG
jgi:hypothetical protein